MKEFIVRKRSQLPEFYNSTNFYWVGGQFMDDDSKWSWVSHYQDFNDYTNWFTNVASKID